MSAKFLTNSPNSIVEPSEVGCASSNETTLLYGELVRTNVGIQDLGQPPRPLPNLPIR